MADTNANADRDPMRALEEWCALPDVNRGSVMAQLRYEAHACYKVGAIGSVADMTAGVAILAAAPALLERVRRGEAGLLDFAEWGLRCDTSPTYAGSRDERDIHRFYQRYMAAQEKHVKERARDFLDAAVRKGREGEAAPPHTRTNADEPPS